MEREIMYSPGKEGEMETQPARERAVQVVSLGATREMGQGRDCLPWKTRMGRTRMYGM